MSLMTSGVMRPPMLRSTRASPMPTPRVWAGSTRQSMHVTMYRLRNGMNGSAGTLRRASVRAKVWLRSRSGAMLDMNPSFVHPQGAARSRTAGSRKDPAVLRGLDGSAVLVAGGGVAEESHTGGGWEDWGTGWKDASGTPSALVGGPVGGGCRPGVAREVHAQVGGAAQAAAGPDVVDG